MLDSEFYCRSCSKVKPIKSLSPDRANCCGSCAEGAKRRLAQNPKTKIAIRKNAQAGYLNGKSHIIDKYGKL